MTTAEALYTPFEAPYRMSMGLMSPKAEEWLELDGRWEAELAEKCRLLADPPEEMVFTAPGAGAAPETGP